MQFEFHIKFSFLGKRIISSVTCKHGHIANRHIFFKDQIYLTCMYMKVAFCGLYEYNQSF